MNKKKKTKKALQFSLGISLNLIFITLFFYSLILLFRHSFIPSCVFFLFLFWAIFSHAWLIFQTFTPQSEGEKLHKADLSIFFPLSPMRTFIIGISNKTQMHDHFSRRIFHLSKNKKSKKKKNGKNEQIFALNVFFFPHAHKSSLMQTKMNFLSLYLQSQKSFHRILLFTFSLLKYSLEITT